MQICVAYRNYNLNLTALINLTPIPTALMSVVRLLIITDLTKILDFGFNNLYDIKNIINVLGCN